MAFIKFSKQFMISKAVNNAFLGLILQDEENETQREKLFYERSAYCFIFGLWQ